MRLGQGLPVFTRSHFFVGYKSISSFKTLLDMDLDDVIVQCDFLDKRINLMLNAISRFKN